MVARGQDFFGQPGKCRATGKKMNMKEGLEKIRRRAHYSRGARGRGKRGWETRWGSAASRCTCLLGKGVEVYCPGEGVVVIERIVLKKCGRCIVARRKG